ncbi:MAG: hypothetical protein HGA65_17295 [Oscillochloris sp.]|nr:hypothetical protein [Oscillochloris sp.]
MSGQQMPWERSGMNAAWYESQPFDVGARVAISDAAWRTSAGAASGRVVGYDASGPLPGEEFIRVLIQPDLLEPTIIAIPPTALAPDAGSELRGIAQTLLVGAEQALRPDQFTQFLQWLSGPVCGELIASPDIRRQRIRAGGLRIPGLVLPELADLARERLGGRR